MTTQLTSCLGLGCQGTKKETASVQEQGRLEMCAELRDRLTKPVQFTMSVSAWGDRQKGICLGHLVRPGNAGHAQSESFLR